MTTALAMAPMTDLQLAPTRRFDTSVRTRNFVSCSLQCKEGLGLHIHSLPCTWQERLHIIIIDMIVMIVINISIIFIVVVTITITMIVIIIIAVSIIVIITL